MKKIVYFYGNCHTQVFADFLNGYRPFREQYKCYGFKKYIRTWYAPDMNKIHRRKLESSLKDVDVFIHQKISNNFRGEKWSSDYLKKQTNGRSIYLSNYFFRGYHPTLCSSTTITNLKNEKIKKNNIEFDAIIFWLFLQNNTINETLDWLQSGSSPEVENLTIKVANDDIREMKRRDTLEINKKHEIIGASDIMNTWRVNQLGGRFNKPSLYYYREMVIKILKTLNIEINECVTNMKIPTASCNHIYHFVLKTLPKLKLMKDVKYKHNIDVKYVGDLFNKFEKETEQFLMLYRLHKIQKFLPL